MFMIYINNKEKLERIKKETNYFVITDFDRTLTTHASEPSMGIVPGYLGGECYVERTKIFEHYRPIELDYSLEKAKKEQYMRNWAKESFNLLSNYVTEDVIENSLEDANLHLRDGAKVFLQELSKKNIPIIVMSSGIGNIVKGFLEKENCINNDTYVISNFFEFEKGKAKIELDNLMATSNKEYKKIPDEIRQMLNNKKYGMLFGDLVEDLKMIDKEKLENTLTFGFLDENIDTNLEKFNNNFDIVLTENEDFNDVKELLNI